MDNNKVHDLAIVYAQAKLQEYQLSKRLLFIASFVTSNMRIGDIGSDHGYLPYYLLNEGKVNYAYACDNKKGPFENLSLTFKDKFNGKIHLALKDGLSDLPKEVNTTNHLLTLNGFSH